MTLHICLPRGVSGGEEGGGRWRIAFPMQWASNYRVEVYLGERQEAGPGLGVRCIIGIIIIVTVTIAC